MRNREITAELGLLRLADATAEDLERNKQTLAAGRKMPLRNDVVTWFLPPVPHALKGGVRTAFMLAQDFSKRWGTLNHIVMYSYSGRDIDTTSLCESLTKHFPDLRYTVDVFRRGVDSVDMLPMSDASFCTLWTTAYLQLKYNRTARKFYLMQDFEPMFYAAGSVSGAIEQTYRFGFSAIANTQGVGSRYRQYSDDVTEFVPGVDRATFFPDPAKRSLGQPAKVVWYGRPSNARNCFGLGVTMLRQLKQDLGDAVQIISVGEDWDEREFGLQGIVENRGLLGSMEEVADLYRSADIGLVFMSTPHPSYQPLEYMASGCVTATNVNEGVNWLLNSENALLLEPVPSVAAFRVRKLLLDKDRWLMVREAGLRSIAEFGWDAAMRTVATRMTRMKVE